MTIATEYDATSILTPASGYISAGYDYTMSPYVGCTFGCRYCYVPSLPYFSEAARSWGLALKVKRNAPELLRRAGRAGKLVEKRVFLSPTTDPYVGQERRFRITRQLLEVICDYPPALLVIQTRSPIVVEDLGLLTRLRERLVVAMSITTDRDDVRSVFESRCSSIRRRVEALEELHAHGIRTQASLAPLLPCDPLALAELVAPHCDWVVVQALKVGAGARTWGPARALLAEHGWEGWLAGGADVQQAMTCLREFFGERYHEARDGFALRWVQPGGDNHRGDGVSEGER